MSTVHETQKLSLSFWSLFLQMGRQATMEEINSQIFYFILFYFSFHIQLTSNFQHQHHFILFSLSNASFRLDGVWRCQRLLFTETEFTENNMFHRETYFCMIVWKENRMVENSSYNNNFNCNKVFKNFEKYLFKTRQLKRFFFICFKRY